MREMCFEEGNQGGGRGAWFGMGVNCVGGHFAPILFHLNISLWEIPSFKIGKKNTMQWDYLSNPAGTTCSPRSTSRSFDESKLRLSIGRSSIVTILETWTDVTLL